MYKLVLALARGMALMGGVVLVALVLLTCVSIAGRALNGVLHEIGADWARALLDLGVGPVTGDFELVEAGMAFAIFAFLPLCHLTAGHASVDIFTSGLPMGLQRFMRAVIETLFAGVLILIAWQLGQGMLSKQSSGQTTFLIQFPVWWAYAMSLGGAVGAALVACYVCAIRIVEAATGLTLLAESEP